MAAYVTSKHAGAGLTKDLIELEGDLLGQRSHISHVNAILVHDVLYSLAVHNDVQGPGGLFYPVIIDFAQCTLRFIWKLGLEYRIAPRNIRIRGELFDQFIIRVIRPPAPVDSAIDADTHMQYHVG